MGLQITDRALAAHAGHPLAERVRTQRDHITLLERRVALAEKREGDAAREIARLKRRLAEMESAP